MKQSEFWSLAEYYNILRDRYPQVNIDMIPLMDKENKFNNVYEIIFVTGGLVNIIDNPNKNSKKWADYILKSWLESKGHKYTVENNRLNKIGVSVYFNTESNTLCVVSVLTNKKID
jgi:hypothetical protein